MKLNYFLLIPLLFIAGIQAMEPMDLSSDESVSEEYDNSNPHKRTAPQSAHDFQNENKRQKLSSLDLAHAVIQNNATQVNFLLQEGSDPNIMVKREEHPFEVTLLTSALLDNNLTIADYLLRYGADINAMNSDGYTALMKTCEKKENLPAVRWLIHNNADLNIDCDDCTTALYIAYDNENLTAIKLLCQAGAHLNATTAQRIPLLHHICREELDGFFMNDFEIKCAVHLLENGADVNIREPEEYENELDTPLHVVTNPHKARLLLYYGANAALRLRNQDNQTPLDIAKEEENFELQELLTSRKKPLPFEIPVGDSGDYTLRDYLFKIARSKYNHFKHHALKKTNIAQFINTRSLGKTKRIKSGAQANTPAAPCSHNTVTDLPQQIPFEHIKTKTLALYPVATKGSALLAKHKILEEQ